MYSAKNISKCMRQLILTLFIKKHNSIVSKKWAFHLGNFFISTYNNSNNNDTTGLFMVGL